MTSSGNLNGIRRSIRIKILIKHVIESKGEDEASGPKFRRLQEARMSCFSEPSELIQ